MQAKDVPDLPVLKFLESIYGTWANWGDLRFDNTVRIAMPDNTPSRVVLAKMRSLHKRGLIKGCTCGCRGDFELTEKGREFLAHSTDPS